MSECHVSPSDLELYVVGALDAARLAEVERHVASCSACEAALMGEARLELAFEQVAKSAARAPVALARARAAHVVPFAGGVAGALAVAAAALLWIVPYGAHHSGGVMSPPAALGADSSVQPEVPRAGGSDAAPSPAASTARLEASSAHADDELDGG